MISQFNLSAMQNHSKQWNRRTTQILLYVGGGGNMFGNSGKLIHLLLHGDNSIYPTGQVDIKGIALYSSTIERGANGPSSISLSYFKDVETVNVDAPVKPDILISIEGSGAGAQAALANILGAELDWLLDS